jgi:hypothetical protein
MELRLLTSREAACYLGGKISASTLAKWRCYQTPGSPQFTRLGGRVVYEAGELERWVAANRHDPGSTP